MDIAVLLIHLIKGEHVNENEWIQFIEDRPFNDKRYYISNSKLKALGWKIGVNFEDGIRDLVNATK